MRETAIEIFLAGVESVKPSNLIRRFVSLFGNVLIINEIKFDLSEIKNIFLIGAGKASAMMAQEIEFILGKRITDGHIITKYGHIVPLKFTSLTEAGHPDPDENGLKGTERIMEIAWKATKDDMVICLLSGGGSALITDIPEGCSLADLKVLNEILMKSGADIREMNCIRKHLSKVKGGQLAKAVVPATLVSLILSDVVGDPLDVIASGPTAYDPTTFANALQVLRKYSIENRIPMRIMQFLKEGSDGRHPETLKENDNQLKWVNNFIIGSNKLALKESAKKAESFGYKTTVVTNTLEGDTVDAANKIVRKALRVQSTSKGEKVCLLFGGELTIKVKAKGLGGRNQHFALLAAKLLENTNGITILSCGTDGSDGPTEATGAVCDAHTSLNARKIQLDFKSYLNGYDSFNFFKKEGGLIITGPTLTNVMDCIVVLIN